MKHIYYFIGLIFVVYEVYWIYKPSKMLNLSKEYKEKEKEFDKITDDDRYFRLFLLVAIPNLVFFLWVLLGLLTYNWVIFLINIILSFFIIKPLLKLFGKNEYFKLTLHWLNSIKGLVLGLFVIINSYHLKIDLYEYIIKIFT